MKLSIGRNLLASLTKETLCQNVSYIRACVYWWLSEFCINQSNLQVFDVLGLLNYGSALITDDDEREELGHLNFTAGIKAKQSTAYGAALCYFKKAHSLISDDFWDTEYEFTFGILSAWIISFVSNDIPWSN